MRKARNVSDTPDTVAALQGEPAADYDLGMAKPEVSAAEASAIVASRWEGIRAERASKDKRDDWIEDQFKRGVRPADIARALRSAAMDVGYTEEQIGDLGISESSVHAVLRERGLKRRRGE
jgi:hypothetical protein